MYLPMLIGIFLIAGIAAGYSVYDGRKQKKLRLEKEAENQRIVEETLKAYQAESAPAPIDTAQDMANEDPRGIHIADLAEYSLRQNMNPFFQIMKYAGRNGDYNVAAVDSNDNIYIIETEQDPQYEDELTQIKADIAHYRTRMQKKADKRKAYVFNVTNHPSEQLREEVEDNPDMRIFNYRIKFRPYKFN